jgi:hypothetical protein
VLGGHFHRLWGSRCEDFQGPLRAKLLPAASPIPERIAQISVPKPNLHDKYTTLSESKKPERIFRTNICRVGEPIAQVL